MRIVSFALCLAFFFGQISASATVDASLRQPAGVDAPSIQDPHTHEHVALGDPLHHPHGDELLGTVTASRPSREESAIVHRDAAFRLPPDTDESSPIVQIRASIQAFDGLVAEILLEIFCPAPLSNIEVTGLRGTTILHQGDAVWTTPTSATMLVTASPSAGALVLESRAQVQGYARPVLEHIYLDPESGGAVDLNGELRKASQLLARAESSSGSEPEMGFLTSQCSRTISVAFLMRYPYTGELVPLVGSRVRLFEEGSRIREPVSPQHTDHRGRVSFEFVAECDAIVHAVIEPALYVDGTPRVHVQNWDGTQYLFTCSIGPTPAVVNMDCVPPNSGPSGALFVQALLARAHHRLVEDGYALRDEVVAYWAYDHFIEGAFYRYNGTRGEIHLSAGASNTFLSFPAYHEFGHHVHFDMLRSAGHQWLPAGGEQHWWMSVHSTTASALIEGWANFFGSYVERNPDSEYTSPAGRRVEGGYTLDDPERGADFTSEDPNGKCHGAFRECGIAAAVWQLYNHTGKSFQGVKAAIDANPFGAPEYARAYRSAGYSEALVNSALLKRHIAPYGDGGSMLDVADSLAQTNEARRAVDLQPGQPVMGDLSFTTRRPEVDRYDYYRMPLSAGQRLHVAVEPSIGHDLELHILRPNGVSVSGINRTGVSTAESHELTADVGGVWVIGVASVPPSEGLYWLRASIEGVQPSVRFTRVPQEPIVAGAFYDACWAVSGGIVKHTNSHAGESSTTHTQDSTGNEPRNAEYCGTLSAPSTGRNHHVVAHAIIQLPSGDHASVTSESVVIPVLPRPGPTSAQITDWPFTAVRSTSVQVCWSVDGTGAVQSRARVSTTTGAEVASTTVQSATAPAHFCSTLAVPATAGKYHLSALADGGASSVESPPEWLRIVEEREFEGVSWVRAPARVEQRASFEVCWRLHGEGSVPHTHLHWGTSSEALDRTTPPRSAAAPMDVCDWVDAPAAGHAMHLSIHAQGMVSEFRSGRQVVELIPNLLLARPVTNGGSRYTDSTFTYCWEVAGEGYYRHNHLHIQSSLGHAWETAAQAFRDDGDSTRYCERLVTGSATETWTISIHLQDGVEASTTIDIVPRPPAPPAPSAVVLTSYEQVADGAPGHTYVCFSVEGGERGSWLYVEVGETPWDPAPARFHAFLSGGWYVFPRDDCISITVQRPYGLRYVRVVAVGSGGEAAFSEQIRMMFVPPRIHSVEWLLSPDCGVPVPSAEYPECTGGWQWLPAGWRRGGGQDREVMLEPGEPIVLCWRAQGHAAIDMTRLQWTAHRTPVRHEDGTTEQGVLLSINGGISPHTYRYDDRTPCTTVAAPYLTQLNVTAVASSLDYPGVVVSSLNWSYRPYSLVTYQQILSEEGVDGLGIGWSVGGNGLSRVLGFRIDRAATDGWQVLSTLPREAKSFIDASAALSPAGYRLVALTEAGDVEMMKLDTPYSRTGNAFAALSPSGTMGEGGWFRGPVKLALDARGWGGDSYDSVGRVDVKREFSASGTTRYFDEMETTAEWVALSDNALTVPVVQLESTDIRQGYGAVRLVLGSHVSGADPQQRLSGSRVMQLDGDHIEFHAKYESSGAEASTTASVRLHLEGGTIFEPPPLTLPQGSWKRHSVNVSTMETATITRVEIVVTTPPGAAIRSLIVDGISNFRASDLEERAEGVHLWHARIVGESGRNVTSGLVEVKVDLTPPQTLATVHGTAAPSGYHTRHPVLTLSAVDSASGVGKMQYRRNGGAIQTYSGPVTFTGQGLQCIQYWASDRAGNAEVSRSRCVFIDTTPPVSSITLAGTGDGTWYSTDVSVSLTSTDSAGIEATYHKVGDGDWRAIGVMSGVNPTITLPFEANGTHTISVYAVDKHGVAENAKTRTFNIERAAPVILGRSPAPGSVAGAAAPILATFEDAPLAPASGIAITATTMRVERALTPAGPWTDVTAEGSITRSETSVRWQSAMLTGMAPGHYKVSGKVFDRAGNSVALEPAEGWMFEVLT